MSSTRLFVSGFKMTSVILLLSMSLQSHSQNLIGTVKSFQGKPLPGVNLVFQNGTMATVTNDSGLFKCTLPPGENIVFMSFVGYFRIDQKLSISADSTYFMTAVLVEKIKKSRGLKKMQKGSVVIKATLSETSKDL